MPSVQRFAFGPFELDIAQRELRHDGQPVALGPRLFDLLHLLVEQRHRVVAREEILARVWAGRVTSPGVLPQAMLKLRGALERGAPTEWFKSARGVGYRFVHPVQELDPAGAPRAPRAAPVPRSGSLRVGMLPCMNYTGDPALQWLCLGLPALAAQMLEADTRLSLIGSATMADYARAAQEPAPADDLALRALRELGLDVVVQGRLTRQSGLLWLHGDLVFSDGRRVPVTSLRGPHWHSLAMRWAESVQELLTSGSGTALTTISPDPFVVEAFARACELFLRGEYAKARPLLQVVHDLEPQQPDVQLQLLRTKFVMNDPSAVPFGEQLVAWLQRQGARPALMAPAHLALALAYTQHAGDRAAAGVHEQLRLALSQCQGQGDQDWALMVRLNAAVLQGRSGELAEAELEFNEVIRQCRRCGNLKRLGQSLTGASMFDLLGGQLALARQRLEEAMDIWQRRVPHVRSAIHTELSLVEAEGLMGCLDSAMDHADRAMAALETEGFLPYLGSALTTAAYPLLDRMDLARARRLLALYGAQPELQHPLVECGRAGVQGMVHLLSGNVDAAQQAWALVHAKAEAANGPGFAVWRAWSVPLLRLALRHGLQTLRRPLEAALRAHRCLARDVELRGVLAHVAAADALADDRRDEAAACLAELSRHPDRGHEPALAALDLAWLHLEDARLDPAQDLLSRLGPWADQHPLGRLLQARLRQAHGDISGAVEQHAQARAQLAGAQASWLAAWPDARQRAPRLPRLLSALHFEPYSGVS
ncbi:winged helix-turn-helix domain-containing protein [Ideonella sp. 4Y11]|uniref:Winged helix-turn-helix domain-containing protein n=1 Tax=Ideonella aquatica TaxID=2824119 RepID=A0A941BR99_9BURK|nr:winged helix-turn-helix domain-containing protein [Ideonella aquatica]MBQ0960120.1 winged helix-turn-helix domain-containing protein [Ideonella aquatica]